MNRLLTALMIMAVCILPAMGAPVRVCGTEWPPFTYAENGKLVRGISIEIYTEAFRRMHTSFSVDKVPWTRCLSEIRNGGRYDAVIDGGIAPGFVHGTHPTSFYFLAIFVRQNSPEVSFSWNMLTGKVVGMVRGYYYGKKVENFTGWHIKRTWSDENMLRLLNANRYNYALGDTIAVPILANKIGIKIKRLMPLVDHEYLYMGFNQKHESILRQLDYTIGKMIADGTMDRIYKNGLGYSYSDLMKMTR